MEEFCTKGREAVKPKATRTGRLKAVREVNVRVDWYIEGREKADRAKGRRIMIAVVLEKA